MTLKALLDILFFVSEVRESMGAFFSICVLKKESMLVSLLR
jgi:hypothetical protein